MKKRTTHFVKFYRDRKRNWRWTARAANGEKVANCGQGYSRRIDALRALLRFCRAWAFETIEASTVGGEGARKQAKRKGRAVT